MANAVEAVSYTHLDVYKRQAYNGVTEYIDYRRYAKATEGRQLEAIWFGDGYSAKARAYTAAERYVNTH